MVKPEGGSMWGLKEYETLDYHNTNRESNKIGQEEEGEPRKITQSLDLTLTAKASKGLLGTSIS